MQSSYLPHSTRRHLRHGQGRGVRRHSSALNSGLGRPGTGGLCKALGGKPPSTACEKAGGFAVA